MRPFEKLIRMAIEDGAESTVENIRNLLNESKLQQEKQITNFGVLP
jgi:hypothetical protein